MILWLPGTRFHLVVYFKIKNFILVDDVAHRASTNCRLLKLLLPPNDAIFDKWHFYGYLVTEVSIFFHKCHKYTLFYIIQWFGYNSLKKENSFFGGFFKNDEKSHRLNTQKFNCRENSLNMHQKGFCMLFFWSLMHQIRGQPDKKIKNSFFFFFFL